MKKKLQSLNREELKLFYKEYKFIWKNLPLKLKLSHTINNIIIDSLIKRVKENSGYYFNNIIFNYMEDNPEESEEETFKQVFTYETEVDQYKFINSFFSYYLDISKKGDYVLFELECDAILPFSLLSISEVYTTFNELYKNIPFYDDSILVYTTIIKTLAIYFIKNNDLIHNSNLYKKICSFFYNNLNFLLDYYKLNYPINHDAPVNEKLDIYIKIVNDLVDKYNKRKENTYGYSKKIY